jgi:hypothetical protein
MRSSRNRVLPQHIHLCWISIRKTQIIPDQNAWRPNELTPTADPGVYKAVVQPIMHLAQQVGKGTIVLKPHALANSKGYITQSMGKMFFEAVYWISP